MSSVVSKPGVSIDTLSGTLSWFRWRGLLLALVFLIGLAGFLGGAEVSDRLLADGVLSRVYYSIGLFVLGGLDLGVPSGGPVWAMTLLWIAYFAAPTITASALVEGAWRILRPRAVMSRLKNHVIVGGCGRLAMLYLKRMHELDASRSVIMVDNRVDNPNAQIAAERYGAHVILGDLSSDILLEALRLDLASQVMLLTGEDYVNLDAASRITQRAPHLAAEISVHVSDLRLLRTLESSQILSQATKFNSYRSAATHLVHDVLMPHFKETPAADAVVLAGFGRFGQTVLDELQTRAHGHFDRVLLFDADVEMLSLVFEDQIGFSDGYQVEVYDGDLRHPKDWHPLKESLRQAPSEPVIVIGSGTDSLNIRTALWLSRKFPDAKIIARCFQSSEFTRQLAKEGHFEIVSTAELLLANLSLNGG